MSFKIIPEDAGNTLDVVEQQLLRRDHPRGYGEHENENARLTCEAGSSPQMRGARRLAFLALLAGRIIPADAGSTPRP